MSKIRVRIAPSPTGLFHLGGLRTALTNFLFARSKGGVFIVRVEDTDQERLVPEAVSDMLGSLKWAGIEVDEGVIGVESEKLKVKSKNSEGENLEDKKAAYEEIKKNIIQKGDFGPYVQSERLPIYQEYVNKLVEKGVVYHCFCNAERLKNLREEQASQKLPPRYDRQCLNLSQDEVDEKIKNGEPFVIRLKTDDEGITEFQDLIRGKIEFLNKNIDDPILMKSDGFPTYHFAVVVDDHLMEISHVLRGEEWIPSTPKHIMIYKAFDFELPQFGHLPNILNMKGGKLSKRDGDVSVCEFKSKGYLPEAVVNFIALLGWNPKTEKESFSLAELIEEFDEQKLNKSAPRFDIERLNWFSALYLKQKSSEELLELCLPYIKEKTEDQELAKKIIEVQKSRMKILSDVLVGIDFVFALPEYSKDLLKWKEMTDEEISVSLQEASKIIEKISEEDFSLTTISETLLSACNASDRGRLLWPLRVALSGEKQSPSPFECLFMLGKEEALRRIEVAVGKLE